MGNIKTQLRLGGDSDNSYPNTMDISLDGDQVTFELANPNRSITASLRRLKIVLTALEAERDEENE